MISKTMLPSARPAAILVAASLALAVGVFSVRPVINDALAACASSDPVNATTAQDAARAMQKAGYTQIKILAKGCDSAWHASAILNGQPVFVVWNREGQVLTEGD